MWYGVVRGGGGGGGVVVGVVVVVDGDVSCSGCDGYVWQSLGSLCGVVLSSRWSRPLGYRVTLG